jgi:hypothetical protein
MDGKHNELMAFGHVAEELEPIASCRADHACRCDGWTAGREPLGGVYGGHGDVELDQGGKRRMGWGHADEHYRERLQAELAVGNGASGADDVRAV